MKIPCRLPLQRACLVVTISKISVIAWSAVAEEKLSCGICSSLLLKAIREWLWSSCKKKIIIKKKKEKKKEMAFNLTSSLSDATWGHFQMFAPAQLLSQEIIPTSDLLSAENVKNTITHRKPWEKDALSFARFHNRNICWIVNASLIGTVLKSGPVVVCSTLSCVCVWILRPL